MERTQAQPKEYKTIAFKGYKIEEDKGIVEHIVSVFGIEDLGGDVVHPGAFTKTIQERGERIRVLDSHRRSSVLDVLGKVLSLREVPKDKLPAEILKEYPKATGGLWARTQFLLDTPEGKGAFLRIKAGAVDEFSFGYDTLDEDFSDDEKGHEVRNLRTIRLWEYSPVIFGMNPATTVLGVKSEDGEGTPVVKGEEGKPAPDVTENTIRMRVRDPGAFQEGTFRTVNIGDKGNGISAVMGRLKGETTMTIQSYIFDKSKWTVERARKWVAAHKSSVIVVELKALNYTRTEQRVREAFNKAYNPKDWPYDYWVKEVLDGFVVVEASGSRVYYRVTYALKEDTVIFSPRGEWISGEYVFVSEEKEEIEPGGPDKCVCPKCKEKVDKKRGVPCRSMKCPKCGAEMVADEDSAEPEKQQGGGAQDLVTIMIEQAQIEIALVEAGPAMSHPPQ